MERRWRAWGEFVMGARRPPPPEINSPHARQMVVGNVGQLGEVVGKMRLVTKMGK